MRLTKLSAVLATLATSFAIAAPSAAQEVQATYGSIFSQGVPMIGCGAIPMSEDGTLKEAGFDISVIHSAQLGSENQLAEQVSSGELEMGATAASILAAWLDDLSVMESYYLYKDTDQVMRVYETETAQELLDELLEVSNIRVIGQPWLYGERHIFGNKELREPEDFQGLRMRVPETSVSIEGARSLGANPTPVAFAELYVALQQGIVDAAETPLAVIEAESFDEPSKYIVLTRHLITAMPFIVNEDFWQSLTEDQQQALEKAVIEGSERVRACAEKQDQEALEKWREEGRLVIIDDANVEAIRENAQAYFSEGLPYSDVYKKLLHDLNQ